MDAMYEVADKLELIHPARFLYNAGSTLKSWNNKMLNDGNFKVLNYEVNSKNVFSNTDIKGGMVLSYDTYNSILYVINCYYPYGYLLCLLMRLANLTLIITREVFCCKLKQF